MENHFYFQGKLVQNTNYVSTNFYGDHNLIYKKIELRLCIFKKKNSDIILVNIPVTKLNRNLRSQFVCVKLCIDWTIWLLLVDRIGLPFRKLITLCTWIFHHAPFFKLAITTALLRHLIPTPKSGTILWHNRHSYYINQVCRGVNILASLK